MGVDTMIWMIDYEMVSFLNKKYQNYFTNIHSGALRSEEFEYLMEELEVNYIEIKEGRKDLYEEEANLNIRYNQSLPHIESRLHLLKFITETKDEYLYSNLVRRKEVKK